MRAGALLQRVRTLPAAQPLLQALPEHPATHLVGGAVRDLLLGRAPRELDLVVEGDSLEVARRIGGSLRRHDRFGTVTVVREPFTYDLARSRRERYPRPGALPEVEPAPLEEDLLRRDFTVNAIAVALSGDHPGELSAAPHALEDLRAGVLRVFHDRSFRDDPTRLLRLGRYAARLGFAVEAYTAELAREAIAAGAPATVSGVRIGNELRLLAREPDPVAALLRLQELGLAGAVDARLQLSDPAAARAAVTLLQGDGQPGLLVLGLALQGVAGEPRRELLARLAFPAAERDVILAVAERMRPLAVELKAATRPSQIAAAAAGAPTEAVAAAGASGPYDAAEAWLRQLRHVRLEISGADLIGAGVPAGPAISRGLRAALTAKLDGQTDGREAELASAVAAACA
jgi:tRNA nucleotidyltransferase (CCA-adding enzyme)